MSKTKNKTVFVLGAGFSMGAGFPSQAALMPNMLNSNSDDIEFEKLIIFLTKSLGFSKENLNKAELEDIFTPIDRAISQGKGIKQSTIDEVVEIRKKLVKYIQLTITSEEGSNSAYFVDDFADYLISLAKERSNDNDSVSVITTNWDFLLDSTVHRKLKNNFIDYVKGKRNNVVIDEDNERETGRQLMRLWMKNRNEWASDSGYFGVVDYCCYMSSLEEDIFIVPGLEALGAGGFNVKFLKLHGSINWLQCGICERMFASFSDDKDQYIDSKRSCKYCSEILLGKKGDYLDSAQLQTVLTMPTFVKDLSGFQLKLIWRNAALELMEASKVVFIGYSLPYADFEFRQVLARMIKNDAEVDVVLHKDLSKDRSDDPRDAPERFKESTAGHRYATFFSQKKSKGKLRITYDGVAKYIDSLSGGNLIQWS